MSQERQVTGWLDWKAMGRMFGDITGDIPKDEKDEKDEKIGGTTKKKLLPYNYWGTHRSLIEYVTGLKKTSSNSWIHIILEEGKTELKKRYLYMGLHLLAAAALIAIGITLTILTAGLLPIIIGAVAMIAGIAHAFLAGGMGKDDIARWLDNHPRTKRSLQGLAILGSLTLIAACIVCFAPVLLPILGILSTVIIGLPMAILGITSLLPSFCAREQVPDQVHGTIDSKSESNTTLQQITLNYPPSRGFFGCGLARIPPTAQAIEKMQEDTTRLVQLNEDENKTQIVALLPPPYPAGESRSNVLKNL